MNLDNFILNTDSYKLSHFKQYPPGTSTVFSYIEARGGYFNETVFFGLRKYLIDVLSKPITETDILEAKELARLHGFKHFNEDMWRHILNAYGGYMPLNILAVQEGTIVPTKNVLLTVSNTDPKCFALTSYVETALLRAIWYPTTVATISHYARKLISGYMNITCDSMEGLDFKFHDFGARGVSSKESSGIGGLAHLLSFNGTDNMEAILTAYKYGYCNESEMPAFSIPAAEHSTITSWERDNEVDAYRNMLKQYGEEGAIISVVSDSYNIYNACEKLWGEALKDEVIASKATLVIRPDSGYPTTVVLKCLHILADKFGFTLNSKGYKVLNNARIIQGDGIDLDMIKEILTAVERDGFSIENITFGCGGGLLQRLDRDTLQFAMKCSAINVNDSWRDVYKEPIDASKKNSRRGLLMLYKNTKTDTYETCIGNESHPDLTPQLIPCYSNGKILGMRESLNDIRNRARNNAG